MKDDYDKFLSYHPEVKNTMKNKSSLYMQALWFYATTLMNEKRYFELVWIQSNLIEVMINSMLHGYFIVINQNTHDKKVKESIINPSFYQKNRLLLALGIINNNVFSNLEKFRKMRNSLMHRLMENVKLGKNIEKLCKNFCELGYNLESELHDLHPIIKSLRRG